MVALAQADELPLGGPAAVAPVVKAHLQRDLDRGGAVAAEEAVAEHSAGQLRQALGQFDGRLVGAASQHDMRQAVELVLERRIDARIGMAEQIDPPGAVCVEVAATRIVEQPWALATHDGERQQLRGALHLRARVPDRTETSMGKIL
ncbi:hypothetical protein GALL_477910 [mine drainage metagenome]|uniref:Uncharacterized protein n=1 Tax=mine drainage metagenome TaxID=410659 RepID=A0A1J5PH92_9ZZZZ